MERETLASGSTGRCAGGVRTLFSDELNVRIALESRMLTREEARELVPQLAVDYLCGAVFTGFDLLVEPERRFMHVTGGAPDFPERLPFTIDFSTSFYFHREGEGILFGGREQSLDELAPHAARRLPALVELEVRHTMWASTR